MFPNHQIFSPFLPQSPARKAGENLTRLSAMLALAVAMALMLQAGCSSSKQVSKEKQETSRSSAEGPSPGAIVMNEDFDPMTLKAPEFRIERKTPPASENMSALAAGQKSDTLALAAAPLDTSWQTVPGYRVQLLQTQDAKLARATVREAILALNTDVEIIYEAPYYKVRAGSFTNRYDAEQLQNLASEKGYANSWVVRTQVKVRASDLLNQQ